MNERLLAYTVGRAAMVLGLAAACLQADQIVLKNGDRLTGTIIQKDEKAITIEREKSFGTVTLPWDEVQSFTTDKPIFVQLQGGQIIEGTVSMSGETMVLAAPAGTRELTPSEIAFLRDASEQRRYERLLRPNWSELWVGTATFGLSGTQGNAETTTLTVGANAERITETDKATIYFKAIKATALVDGINATSAQAVRGGWAYSPNITPRVFLNFFNDWEYDRFQSLDLRFVLGGGLGYILWEREGRGRLDLLGGGAYNRSNFAAQPGIPGFTRNSGDLYFGDDFTYRLNASTSLYQNLRTFPSLSDTGEYRLNFDLGANTQLTEWLTWTIAISDRFLSNPVPGRERNDFLYTTAIGVSFAR